MVITWLCCCCISEICYISVNSSLVKWWNWHGSNTVCPVGYHYWCNSGPLYHIAIWHGLQVHLYADNTQLYIQFDLSMYSAEEARTRLEACIADLDATKQVEVERRQDWAPHNNTITPVSQSHHWYNQNLRLHCQSKWQCQESWGYLWPQHHIAPSCKCSCEVMQLSTA